MGLMSNKKVNAIDLQRLKKSFYKKYKIKKKKYKLKSHPYKN